VVDDGGHLREEPFEGGVVERVDGGRQVCGAEPAPAGVEQAALTAEAQRFEHGGGDLSRVAQGHTAEADEYRRRAIF
jgi:hypothetical protein